MNWKCFFGFHDWTMWNRYIDYYTGTFTWGKNTGKTFDCSKEGQRRSCIKCGFMQDIIKN